MNVTGDTERQEGDGGGGDDKGGRRQREDAETMGWGHSRSETPGKQPLAETDAYNVSPPPRGDLRP